MFVMCYCKHLGNSRAKARQLNENYAENCAKVYKLQIYYIIRYKLYYNISTLLSYIIRVKQGQLNEYVIYEFIFIKLLLLLRITYI